VSQAPVRQHEWHDLPVTGDGPPAPPGRWSTGLRWYVPAAVGFVVMIGMGLWGLSRQGSMGNDEVATKWAALLNWYQLQHLLRRVDAVHGFYYALMHMWAKVGTSPAVLRIPSVIAMAVAVGLVAVIARRLTGSGWTAVFAALIMAVTPSISYYAQTARSYAMVVAGVAALTLILIHAIAAEARAPGTAWRWWAAYAAVLSVTAYLNELVLAVLAAHAVTLWLSGQGKAAIRRWALFSLAAIILVGPLLWLSSRESGVVDWITTPGGIALLLQVHDYFGGGIFAPIFVASFCAAAILPLRRADWRSSGGTVTLPAIAAPLILPAVLLIIESFVFRPMYVDRYVLYGEIGAALLAGSGLTRIGHWLRARYNRARLEWVGGLAGVLIVAFANIWAQNAARQPESRLFDFGAPSAYIAVHAKPGDGVLFATGFYRKAKLAYPEDWRNVTDFSIAIPPGKLGTFQGRDLGFWAIRANMLKYHRIWVVGRPPSYPPVIPPFRALAHTIETHFIWQSREDFQGITVSLWIRKANDPVSLAPPPGAG
jgi:mannosyltransferase